MASLSVMLKSWVILQTLCLVLAQVVSGQGGGTPAPSNFFMLRRVPFGSGIFLGWWERYLKFAAIFCKKLIFYCKGHRAFIFVGIIAAFELPPCLGLERETVLDSGLLADVFRQDVHFSKQETK